MAVKFDFGSLDKPFEADWPVTVSVPVGDGKVEEQRFSARFRLLRQEDHDRIAKAEGDNELLKEFFVGFGKGEDAELTEELFTKMVGTAYVRNALMKAYFQFAAGIPEKN